MKWMIIIPAIFLAGCQTCPPKTNQLILNVPAELMQKPAAIETL